MTDELSREERERGLRDALNRAFNDDMLDSVISGITTRVVRGQAGEPSAEIEILSGGQVVARESEELIYATAHQFNGGRDRNTEYARRRILADMEAHVVIRHLAANTHPERELRVDNIIGPAANIERSSERFRFDMGMRNDRGEDLAQRIDLWFARRDNGERIVTGGVPGISVSGLHRALERLDNEQRGRLLAAISDTAPNLLQNIPRRLRPDTGLGSIAYFRLNGCPQARARSQASSTPPVQPQPITVILSEPSDPNNLQFGPDLLPLPGPAICRFTGHYVGDGANRRFQIDHLDLDERGRWVQHDESLAIPGSQDLRTVRLPISIQNNVPNFGSIEDQIRGRIEEFRDNARIQRRESEGRQSNLTPTPNLNLTMTPVDTVTALGAAPNAPLNPQVLLNNPERDGHG